MACTALASSSALAGLQQRRAIPASSSPAGSGAVLPRRHRCTAAAAATPLGLLAELPAQASEAFIDTTAGIPDVGQAAADAAADAAAAQAAAAAEAFAAAQQAAGSDPSELVFTALFGVAIAALSVVTLGVAYLSFTSCMPLPSAAVAALSVVTLGVAYLSFTSWMDSRTEADDRRRISGMGGVSSGSNGAGPKKAPKKKEGAAKEPEEFKGFGSKK